MTALADVDAVLWDIGGVILDLESVPQAHVEFVGTLVDEYDSRYDREEAVEVWRETLGAYFREREGTEFRPAREGYRRAIAEIVEDDLDEDDWRDTFERLAEDYASAHPDAVAAIERIAPTAIHQGVVSDVDHEEGRRLLEAFGVFRYFDAYTTSESVGRTKPDPAMFEAALDAAGVEPAAAVMIGDRYSNDMEGASNLGITTIAYGADDGPAVDYRLEDLRELPGLLGIDAEE